MKNDVVRWSRQPTSNTTNSSSSSRSDSNSSSTHKHRSKCNKLNARQLGSHAARSCQQRSSAATTLEDEQQTIIECDIGNFNFDCNLFKTSFLTQHKQKLSGKSSSKSKSNRSRPLAKTKAVLLLALQFSAVVFLCNINVGFVAGSVATAASSAGGSSPAAPSSAPSSPPTVAAPPPPPPSSPLKVGSNGQSPVLPPYVLDYETGGRAKLTPNNGKFGQSGSSGSNNNHIVGHYTHTWAVHIPNGDNGMADAVAKDHGFVNLGKVSNQ
ncbi:GM17714 [Drosophila sechellia]|uniref:GM17714 n=1 Tax=Drosophila sechellia TaxID=7238 RepID=B4IJN3_DROSE|nr:GM17714 [Drosophila sechellia]